MEIVQPHARAKVLGVTHQATADDAREAVAAARKAARPWRELSFDDRAAVFLKAADLLAGPWRQTLNAATLLGQSKTAFQAEIDAACELIDFWRFNVAFAGQMLAEQPRSSPGVWNRTDHRPLEGFVYAVTPFNFTAIAGNLPTAPALMGNTVVWKPAHTQQFAAHFLMALLEEAGLPPGVINMVTGNGIAVSDVVLADPDLAGIHFTGSTRVFQQLWSRIGENIASYRSYPRIVGETGGKDFVMAHPSADVDVLRTAMVRGAFEYQGQKCSAASRAYVPRSPVGGAARRPRGRGRCAQHGPHDRSVQLHGRGHRRPVLRPAVKGARPRQGRASRSPCWPAAATTTPRAGSYGRPYWSAPTPPMRSSPRSTSARSCRCMSMTTATIGNLRQMESASPYALTGSVIAQDRQAIAQATDELRFAAGNFYINDKPTGAVVGQQPFGGGRASGTNDKAGAAQNLLRWTSTRSIKETFVPAKQSRHPHQD